ncbi:MAG: winged helix-turn-helix transcriptional regulator [Methylocella sp.]
MRSGYDQDCPVAKALDIVGEKWALLVLRDLFRKGPLRFQDFSAGLPGVAPNTLSARLKTLEKLGVIGTRLYEQHPPRFEYFLTDKGQALGPVLKALYKWGELYG